MRTKTSLTEYDVLPEGMAEYLSHYGKHFSKNMYMWAVSMMRKKDNTGVTPITKEDFKNKLNAHGVQMKYDTLYDGMYIYCMALADFFGSSIVDERHLMLFVKDYVDDPDAVDGFIFNRFYADCCLKGEPVDWVEMM